MLIGRTIASQNMLGWHGDLLFLVLTKDEFESLTKTQTTLFTVHLYSFKY